MKNKTVTFIGHSECIGLNENKVTNEIEKLVKKGYDKFLCGGMGQFDYVCAKCVYKLKIKFPGIKNYLIIPYLTFSIQESLYFDEIIYPKDFEKYHFKSAICKRNQYLVDNADIAICYINHDWGGAAKTYQQAIKKGLKIINLGTFIK